MGLISELFRVRRYKTNQGRLIRRMTMAGIWAVFATGAWKCTLMDWTWIANLIVWLEGFQDESAKDASATILGVLPYILAGLVVLVGFWFGYRLVNWATFTDFLISVEAEMVKVSWPGAAEVRSSTIVVLAVFALLSATIYVFDLIWVAFFRAIGVV